MMLWRRQPRILGRQNIDDVARCDTFHAEGGFIATPRRRATG